MIRNNDARTWKPRVEPLEERLLLSTTHHAHRATNGGGGGSRGAQVFQVTLTPVNNSGVSGQGTITRRGNKLKVDLEISGLEPGLVHQQHIHGFGDPAVNTAPEWGFTPNDRASQCPPTTASTLIPKTPDVLPGLISEHQSEVFTGPEMKDLTIGDDSMIYPAADATGHLSYHETLKAETSSMKSLGNLALRAIEIHGAFVSDPDTAGNRAIVHAATPGTVPPNASYVPLLPVACGQITRASAG